VGDQLIGPFARGMVIDDVDNQHLVRFVLRSEREKIVLAALPELSMRIIEHTREHGRVTISDIVRLTGTSRNTLKQHFRQLVAEGHLALHGSGRGAWYALP
jgi:predicted HTH transcriptional regulator